MNLLQLPKIFFSSFAIQFFFSSLFSFHLVYNFLDICRRSIAVLWTQIQIFQCTHIYHLSNKLVFKLLSENTSFKIKASLLFSKRIISFLLFSRFFENFLMSSCFHPEFALYLKAWGKILDDELNIKQAIKKSVTPARLNKTTRVRTTKLPNILPVRIKKIKMLTIAKNPR